MIEELKVNLKTPVGRSMVPKFNGGWLSDEGSGELLPYLDYTGAVEVNWSDHLEEMHEESSRNHFIDIFTRHALIDGIDGSFPPYGVIADLGCSTGYLLEDMHCLYHEARLLGVDMIAQGLIKAHENIPEAALVRADVCDLPFEDETIDAAVSANLLEHVSDDVKALAEVFRTLKSGARFAAVVPYGPRLYDYYDKYLGHERRYSRSELARKAISVGFEVELNSCIGSLLYPPFWLRKKLNRIKYRNVRGAGIEKMVERNITSTQDSAIATLACKIERSLRQKGLPLPVGIRSFVVLKKP